MNKVRNAARRRIVAAAAAVLLATALAACTGTEGGGDDGDSAAPKTLTIAVGAQPPTLDPAALDLGESGYIWTGIFDTLLKVDDEGTILPNAAESFEYSEDGLTLTLTLREGMTFSSGDPVTSEDVAATLERMQSTPGVRTGDVGSIASVDTPDDATVVLHLSVQDPALLVNLATGAGVIADAATVGDDTTALNPIGSGPYVLNTDSTVNGSSYVLDRRDDYWNLDAYPFETVTVRIMEDAQARFNALQAGEIQYAPVGPDQVETVEAAGLTVKSIEATSVGSIVFTDKTGAIVPALGEAKVREAINMAFDRQLYVDQLLLGAGRPTEQFYNPAQAGYVESLNGYWEYDVDGAKALLAEAGYPDGFDVSMPSSFLSTAFEPAITQSLADIGVRVTWEAVPPQEIVSSLSSGKFGLAWFFEGLNAPSIMTPSNLGPTGLLNPSGYTTPELDALLAEARTTTDPAGQGEIYEEISTYAVENALIAPLFYTSAAEATADGVVYIPDAAVPVDIRNFGVEG